MQKSSKQYLQEEDMPQQQQGNLLAAMMAAVQATQTSKVAQALKDFKEQKKRDTDGQV